MTRPLFVLLLIAACAPPPPKWPNAPTQAKSSLADASSDYFSGPWPDDRRLKDGRLRTRGFPNPGETSLAKNLFETADSLIEGWGLSAPMYVPLSGPIDKSTLPQTPEASQAKDSSLYVVAIDPASPVYGVRMPIEWTVFEQTTLYLHENTLALRPLMGFPLQPSTQYAIIMTTDVRDANGERVGADKGMWEGLFPIGEPTTFSYYGTLRRYLEAQKVDLKTIAIGVPFKTQPIMDELHVLYDYLSSLPAPTIDHAVLHRTRTGSYTFHADYQAPYLLHGTAPYEQQGGEFKYDETGAPIVSKVETMRLAIIVPRTPMPPDGFPVVMYSHGTGGNYDSVTDIGYELAAEGIASVGIDQVIHGPRVPAGSTCFGQDAEICFFNPVNAKAGRNLTRMGALDQVMVKKLLASGTVPPTVHPDGVTVKFDPKKVGFFGHSQGGLTGAIYAAVEHDLSATVISGTGGHLLTTVLLRTDPIDLRQLAEGPFLNFQGKESIGPFHPALALLQTLAEASDPLNYAPHWLQDETGLQNFYMTSGLDDPYTPAIGAAALAGVAGLPQWSDGSTGSPAHEMRGIAKVSGPLSANLSTPRGAVTGVFRQFPNEGHFPVFDTAATDQWRALFVGAFFAVSGTATIP